MRSVLKLFACCILILSALHLLYFAIISKSTNSKEREIFPLKPPKTAENPNDLKYGSVQEFKELSQESSYEFANQSCIFGHQVFLDHHDVLRILSAKQVEHCEPIRNVALVKTHKVQPESRSAT